MRSIGIMVSGERLMEARLRLEHQHLRFGQYDHTTAFSTNNYYFNRKHRRLGMLRTTIPK